MKEFIEKILRQQIHMEQIDAKKILPLMFAGFLPVRWTSMVSGTLNQASPVAIPTARSVVPTPVEKPFTAP